ncbi:MAG: ribbon-helix-helix protein, CopG family [Reyranellaceae bacterium]
MTTKRAPSSPPSPVSIKLADDERARLASLASARKRSSHYLMREAIQQYLTREEARQSFRDEADEARRDYEKAGLHVTHAEVKARVNSLGTSRPKRAPKWHK